MLKKKKVWIASGIGILVLCLAVALFIFLSGGYRIEFGENWGDNLSFEYGREADIPEAYVVNRYGIRQLQEVSYRITSAEGEVTETEYPVAKCDSVGKWTVECIGDKAETSYSFEVVDTVAPEIIVGKLPSDVYIDNKEAEYTIPAVDFKDSSPIDYQNCSVDLFFEGEKVTYNEFTSEFEPERWGEYILKIQATDIYGNSATEECSWRAKDIDWKDDNLPEGYLATFDDVGYSNLISSGYINKWWKGTETEEFLEEYKGEKGVLKLNMNYVNRYTATKVRLARYITPEELGDKKLVIRYLVEDKIANGQLTLAGNYVESWESSLARRFDYIQGEWSTAILDAGQLDEVSYVDEDGILRTLQMAFIKEGSGSVGEVYLSSITMADTLEVPKNVKAKSGILTWDAVEHAQGYKVYVDDEVISLSKEERSCKIGKGKVFRIVACGDNTFYLDSSAAFYVNDTPKKGYLAEFDEEYYKYLIWNNGGNVEGGMQDYQSDSFACAYDKKKDAIRLDLVQGYVAAGTVVRLPKTTKVSDMDNLVIRLHLDENVKRVRIYQYGGTGRMLDVTDLKKGWNTLTIAKELLLPDSGSENQFSGFQLILYANEDVAAFGSKQGTKMTAYLDSVTVAEKLQRPQNLKMKGKTLSWDKVSDAKGYLVIEDGKETIVKKTSYRSKGGECFLVYALGDEQFYIQSDMAVYVNDTLPDKYLATFSKEYYEYLVWNNGAGTEGGMQYYECDDFQVTYKKGIHLEMTQGYVASGIVVRLPNMVDTSTLKNMVIRFKSDGSIKRVRIYQYGGEGKMWDTTDVKKGWNTLVIPKAQILSDSGVTNQFSGFQMIFNAEEEAGHGIGQGTKMSVQLGSVTMAEKLEMPQNLRLNGNQLTWDKVLNAESYIVVEDGKCTTVKSNSYPIKRGDYIQVYAVGDVRFYQQSDMAIYVSETLPKNYLATFDKKYYEHLVWNNGAGTEGGMLYYESDEFKATYDKTKDGLKIEMTHGYVAAGAVVRLPKTVSLSELENVVIRFKSDGNVKRVRIYQYGGEGRMLDTTDVKKGWNTLVIPKALLLPDSKTVDQFSGFQMIFNAEEKAGDGVGRGTKITVYLGAVTTAKSLEKPTNLKLSGQTLTWDKVPGATGYRVYEDEKVTTVKTNSYTVGNGNVISVEAIGDGIASTDSEKTVYLNAKVPEGVLAAFDKAYYEYLIWNNGATADGGMKDYESASFEAKFNETEKVMDVTAGYGFVAAGLVVKFPQEKTLETDKDVVVNIKLDGNVKAIRMYRYGSENRLFETNEVKEGWNEFVIPKENLVAALGENAFRGMQIILYNNADFKWTQFDGTAHISLGEIAYKKSGGESSGYTPIKVSSVADWATSATRIFLQLEKSTGAALWSGLNPVSDADGIFYNGTKIGGVMLEVQDPNSIVYFGISNTPETGDTITVKGRFAGSTVGLDIAQFTLVYNGTTWVSKLS